MSVTPEITPFILISYTGNPRSVATLAHELGHSVHAQLSGSRKQSTDVRGTLPLAETASVFGELLLTDRLLAESNEAMRKSLLLEMINDAYGTILRQSFFVLFERDAHDAIPNGMNIDEISDLYLKNLKTQFGDSLKIPDEFRNEWLSIPHIFSTPFYCYSYAWGSLLVMALYKQYREEGVKSFAPRYMKMLSYGGSEAPERILKEAGFDVRSKALLAERFRRARKIAQRIRKPRLSGRSLQLWCAPCKRKE